MLNMCEHTSVPCQDRMAVMQAHVAAEYRGGKGQALLAAGDKSEGTQRPSRVQLGQALQTRSHGRGPQ